MKKRTRLLATVICSLMANLAMAAFPTNTSSSTHDIAKLKTDWNDFTYTWRGWDDQEIIQTFSNNGVALGLTNYLIAWRVTLGDTLYISKIDTNVVRSTNSVYIRVVHTNVPPVGVYKAETLLYDSAATSLTRSIARGKINVLESIWSNTNLDNYPFPDSLIVTTTNEPDFQANGVTNATVTEGVANSVSKSGRVLAFTIKTNYSVGDASATFVQQSGDILTITTSGVPGAVASTQQVVLTHAALTNDLKTNWVDWATYYTETNFIQTNFTTKATHDADSNSLTVLITNRPTLSTFYSGTNTLQVGITGRVDWSSFYTATQALTTGRVTTAIFDASTNTLQKQIFSNDTDIADHEGRITTIEDAGYLTSLGTNRFDSLVVANLASTGANACSLSGVYTGDATKYVAWTGTATTVKGYTYLFGFKKQNANGTGVFSVAGNTYTRTAAGAGSNYFAATSNSSVIVFGLYPSADLSSKSDASNVFVSLVTNGTLYVADQAWIGKRVTVGNTNGIFVEDTTISNVVNMYLGASGGIRDMSGKQVMSSNTLFDGGGVAAIKFGYTDIGFTLQLGNAGNSTIVTGYDLTIDSSTTPIMVGTNFDMGAIHRITNLANGLDVKDAATVGQVNGASNNAKYATWANQSTGALSSVYSTNAGWSRDASNAVWAKDSSNAIWATTASNAANVYPAVIGFSNLTTVTSNALTNASATAIAVSNEVDAIQLDYVKKDGTVQMTAPLKGPGYVDTNDYVNADDLARAIGTISAMYASTNLYDGVAITTNGATITPYQAQTFLPTHTQSVIQVATVTNGQYLGYWISNTGIVLNIRAGVAVIGSRQRAVSLTGPTRYLATKPEIYIWYSENAMPELFETSQSNVMTEAFVDRNAEIDCTNVTVPATGRVVVAWRVQNAVNSPTWEFQCGTGLIVAARLPTAGLTASAVLDGSIGWTKLDTTVSNALTNASASASDAQGAVRGTVSASTNSTYAQHAVMANSASGVVAGITNSLMGTASNLFASKTAELTIQNLGTLGSPGWGATQAVDSANGRYIKYRLTNSMVIAMANGQFTNRSEIVVLEVQHDETVGVYTNMFASPVKAPGGITNILLSNNTNTLDIITLRWSGYYGTTNGTAGIWVMENFLGDVK